MFRDESKCLKKREKSFRRTDLTNPKLGGVIDICIARIRLFIEKTVFSPIIANQTVLLNYSHTESAFSSFAFRSYFFAAVLQSYSQPELIHMPNTQHSDRQGGSSLPTTLIFWSDPNDRSVLTLDT